MSSPKQSESDVDDESSRAMPEWPSEVSESESFWVVWGGIGWEGCMGAAVAAVDDVAFVVAALAAAAL